MTLKTKLLILLIIVLIGSGTGVFYYLKSIGLIKTGAEAIIGCQNSRDISSFFGAPGSNLVSYNLFGQEITVNQLLPPYLDNIQKEVNAAKTGYNFNTIYAYNNRSKIGGYGKSLHSWGIAIDINPDSNPYERGNYGPPTTDIPGQIIDIFKKHGFAWGGDWPGERDPMHFEWYGASMSGQIIDKVSGQKLLSVATEVNGSGSPNANGEYKWIMPFGTYVITSKSRGYKDNIFSVSLACFSDTTVDIAMEALPSNVAGSIAGKIIVSGNYPILMPSTIFLDGRTVGVSNNNGEYYIPNVREGKHKIEAKVLYFPNASTEVVLVPGENITNANIIVGK